VGDMLTDFGESPVLTFASQPVLLSTAT
jgi:hypothetical protein